MSSGRVTISFGAYDLIVEARELWRDGRRVRLAPQAITILIELTTAPDTLVTREHLRAVLWPDGIHVDFEGSLNTAVRKLRAALGDNADAPRYVQTVPGRGYRFIAPVRRVYRPSLIDAEVRPDEPHDDSRVAATVRSAWWRNGLRGRLPRAAAMLCAAATIAIVVHVWPGRELDSERSGREAATTNGAALDAYRRGQAAAHARRIEDLAAAMAAFETALRLDPEFAPAWGALARTRAMRAIRDGRDAGELGRADAEAARALALDRDLAEAHVALGLVRFARDRDLAGADAWFQRARARGANTGRDLLWHACVLNAQRRFTDAMRILDEAIAREPRMAALHAWRGLVLHALHRYDEELVALRHAASLDPQSPEALFHLGLGYARRRQYDLALPAMRRAAALSGEGAFYVSWFGRIAADAGNVAAAKDALQELEVIARTRGLAPALSGAVSHHIETRRQQSGGL